jgi:hypothetical protein
VIDGAFRDAGHLRSQRQHGKSGCLDACLCRLKVAPTAGGDLAGRQCSGEIRHARHELFMEQKRVMVKQSYVRTEFLCSG